MRLALLAILLAGCSSLEVTALIGPRYVGREDGELALTVQVLKQVGETRWRCGATHSSVINKGPPINHRDEIAIDHLACGPRWSKQ